MKLLKYFILSLIIATSMNYAQISPELVSSYASDTRDTAWVNKVLHLTASQLTTDLNGTIGYISSVKAIAQKLGYAKGVFEATIQQTEYYRLSRQVDSASRYVTEIIELGDKSGVATLKCRSRIAKALYLSTRERNSDAIATYDEAISYIDTSKEQYLYASVLTNRAINSSNLDRHEEAVQDYLKAARIFEKINDLPAFAVALNNIAYELGRLKKYKTAIGYYDRAIEINEKTGNFYDLAMCYSNASTILRTLNLLDQAHKYVSKGMEIAEKRGYNLTLAQCYTNSGSIYKAEKNPQKAEMMFKKSLDLCYKAGITYGIMVNFTALGELFDQFGDEMKAVAHYDSAMKYAKQMDSQENIYDLHDKLADVFAKTGNFTKAYEHLRLLYDYKDSTRNNESSARIVELEKLYETEKQRAEIVRLEQVTSNQLFIIITLTGIAITSLLLIFFFKYKRKKAEEAAERAAKHSEEIEKYSEELRELNESKNKLFSLISHDIRGPFMPILMFSEELANNSDHLSREEINQISVDLQRVSESTFFLISNLLDWARTQMGRIQFNPENILLSDIVSRLQKGLGYALSEKNVTLKIDIPENVELVGDRTMLNSIFQNIIQNAIKFSKEGSEINLKGTVANGLITLSFVDTGVGMTNDVLNSLFRLSGVASQRGTNNEKGTGLGMSITAEFVERHSGTISVESEPGLGTTITVILPLSGPKS